MSYYLGPVQAGGREGTGVSLQSKSTEEQACLTANEQILLSRHTIPPALLSTGARTRWKARGNIIIIAVCEFVASKMHGHYLQRMRLKSAEQISPELCTSYT